MSDVLKALLERGRSITPAAAVWELEQWHTMVLTALEGIVESGDPLWRHMDQNTTSSRWPRPRRAWRRFAAERGALEGLLLRISDQEPSLKVDVRPAIDLHETAVQIKDVPDGVENDQPKKTRILVLGPAQVADAPGRVASNRRRSLTELACWIFLNPGSHHAEMDAALADGRPVLAESRNPRVSRLRSWLGHDALPHYSDQSGYRLTEVVSSDWTEFQRYVVQAQQRPRSEAAYLRAALSLVRGEPLCDPLGIPYAWATPVAAEMGTAIRRTALRLADISVETGHAEQARWAIERGLRAGGRSLEQGEAFAVQ
ncbi:bacterial transcriptional activator domain-containing protein [Streptomyces sp. NPDC006692]|uniref:bacterial transcriptional activator domain-containing protein n=1 Tax=unclassified Streptomyces TaxID=2593676 RepID=UPI003447B422